MPFMVAIYGWFAVYLIKMVIFHSYVSLPEDNCQLFASLRQSVSKVGNDWTQVSINLCNIHVTPMQKSGHDYFFHYVYQFLFNVSSCFPNMLPNFSSFLPICSHFLRKFHRLSQLSPTFPQFPPTFPQLFRSFSPGFATVVLPTLTPARWWTGPSHRLHRHGGRPHLPGRWQIQRSPSGYDGRLVGITMVY